MRITRVRPQEYRVAAPKPIRPPPQPAFVLLSGFAAMIAIGTVLLILPFSSASGSWTSPIDALFTATSAVCVTGLVVLDTGTYWSGFGQAVILGLIQAGGFGFMTSSTLLLVLLVGRRTRLRDRVLVQETMGVTQLGGAMSLVRRVAGFTLIAELVGAA
ncbi:MAG: Trk family potassium uptake protein, partial [Chloroflexi bacterium]|nr:Trk family potassium uptake protein [Chloroflexota bacterium]